MPSKPGVPYATTSMQCDCAIGADPLRCSGLLCRIVEVEARISHHPLPVRRSKVLHFVCHQEYFVLDRIAWRLDSFSLGLGCQHGYHNKHMTFEQYQHRNMAYRGLETGFNDFMKSWVSDNSPGEETLKRGNRSCATATGLI
jgi:hypothetical protein